MRRFSSKLFLLVLLLSLCSARSLGAGIELETTVQRVLADGSFERLEFPTEDQASLGERASDPIQTEDSTASNFQAGGERSFDVLSTAPELSPAASAWNGNLQALVSESASVPSLLPDLDEVAVGDLLRYEIRVHNANAFSVPAFALELIEHLPPGVTFVGLSAGQADWAIQPSTPTEGLDAEALAALQSSLRLHNSQILAAGAYSFFSYDVVVQAPMEAELLEQEVRSESERVPVLDDSRTQLQLQD
jgi:hypothetical protein